MKPTPGPWRVVHNTTTDSFSVYTSDPERDSCIAVIPESFGARTELANARLMAAAPDLLEALTVMTSVFRARNEPGPAALVEHAARGKAIAAVQKARGES